MILCSVTKIFCKHHRLVALNSIIFSLVVFLAATSLKLFADGPRTDGPPGSEYGRASFWDGELQVGARFGALIRSNDSDKTTIMAGADLDFRPYDLFGVQLSYLQGLQKKGRISVFNFTPLIHTEFANLRPYAIFGPGIAMFNANNDLQTKFAINFGAGADFMITDHIGVGMNYTYHALFDAFDLHSIGARVFYSWGR